MNKNSKFYKAFDEIKASDKVVENILNHKTKERRWKLQMEWTLQMLLC